LDLTVAGGEDVNDNGKKEGEGISIELVKSVFKS
jgi:hypothetical protein